MLKGLTESGGGDELAAFVPAGGGTLPGVVTEGAAPRSNADGGHRAGACVMPSVRRKEGGGGAEGGGPVGRKRGGIKVTKIGVTKL